MRCFSRPCPYVKPVVRGECEGYGHHRLARRSGRVARALFAYSWSAAGHGQSIRKKHSCSHAGPARRLGGGGGGEGRRATLLYVTWSGAVATSTAARRESTRHPPPCPAHTHTHSTQHIRPRASFALSLPASPVSAGIPRVAQGGQAAGGTLSIVGMPWMTLYRALMLALRELLWTVAVSTMVASRRAVFLSQLAVTVVAMLSPEAL